jgi:hypothetical protein
MGVRSSAHVGGVEPGAGAVETIRVDETAKNAKKRATVPTESVKPASRRFGMAPLYEKQKTPDYTPQIGGWRSEVGG